MGNVGTITRKGQVTIPSGIRRKLGLSEGDSVVFREDRGLVILEPATRAVSSTAGVFRRFVSGDALSAADLHEAVERELADESRRRADG